MPIMFGLTQMMCRGALPPPIILLPSIIFRRRCRSRAGPFDYTMRRGVHGLPVKIATKLGKESGMGKVRVLVGTRKGAFVLRSDAKRARWDISGPHFAGWEIYHLKGSPADPN